MIPLIARDFTTEQMDALLAEDAGLVVWWGTAVEFESAIARSHCEGKLDAEALRAAIDRSREIYDSALALDPGIWSISCLVFGVGFGRERRLRARAGEEDGSGAEKQVQRGPDHHGVAPGRAGHAGGADLPQAGNQPGDVLPVEEDVRQPGSAGAA